MHLIVTGHHPVLSASTLHGDTYEMVKIIKPIFDKYKVDFYICITIIHFEHAKDSTNSTNYIVTGTFINLAQSHQIHVQFIH